MRKTKQKQTAIVRAEPETVGKPAEKNDYYIGYLVLKEEKDRYIAGIQIGKGIKRENIKVKVDNDSLEFKVSQREDKEEKDEKRGYHYLRSSALSYYNMIPIPLGIDAEKISYSMGEGRFLVYLPKKEDYKKLGPAKKK
jgi:HSP20 family molecular chaperone IbpA